MTAALHKRYYLAYTVVFIVLAPLVFLVFLRTGTGFVWELDGMNQHYQALVYYGRWLRGIARSVLAGAPAVPLWDFSIGYGSDVLTTLSYYVIGDPLALVSAFVPSRYAEALYYALDVVRFYLAGVAFSAFCRKLEADALGTLVASMAYVFCGWMVIAGVTHPFFINPLIYLPLILLGFEKVLRGESPVPFIVFVGVAGASNFYFFYMLVIALFVYAIARFFTYYGRGERRLARFASLAAKSFGLGVVGVLLAGTILLPSVLAFLDAGRSSFGTENPLVYSLSHYKDLPASFITPYYAPNYCELGYSAPLLLGVFSLFAQRRGRLPLKVVFVLASAVFLVPAAGAAMNGFSYATNRWTFIYSFLVCYIFAVEWSRLARMPRRRAAAFAVLVVAYFVLIAVLGRLAEPAIVSCAVLVAALVACVGASMCSRADGSSVRGRARHAAAHGRLPGLMRGTRTACVALVVLLTFSGVVANSYYFWGSRGRDTIEAYVQAGTVAEKSEKTAAYKVGKVQAEDGAFNRIDIQTHPVKNTSINARSHTTQYFWSIAKGNICDYMTEVGVTHRRASDNYYRLEARAMLESLASVKYYACKDGVAPYGFSRDEGHSTKGRQVYASGNALPLGYVDTNYFLRGDWLALDLAGRQEALFQATVVDDGDALALDEVMTPAQPAFEHESVDYEVELGEGIVRMGGNALLVGKAGATAALHFDGLPDCETYVQVTGMNVEYKTAYGLYMDGDSTMYPRDEFEALPDERKRALELDASIWGEQPTQLYDVKFEANGRSQAMRYSTPDYRYSSGQRDFLVSFGYSAEPLAEAVVTFPQPGVYSCDDVKVVCQPFGNVFAGRVAACQSSAMRDESFPVNGVAGTVSTETGGLLRLSVPYDRGWKAYVDGVEAQVMRVDGMFVGVLVGAGDHRVELRYLTYGLAPGLGMTALGAVLLAALICRRVRKAKRGRQEREVSNEVRFCRGPRVR